MSRLSRFGLVMSGLMFLSAWTAKLITPTVYFSDTRPALEFEKIIPVAFGGWKEKEEQNAHIVNPEIEASLKKVYAQTLSRSYINSKGDYVMVSIAYGKDQRDAVQLHYPEVCYPAQGFQIISKKNDILQTARFSIPLRLLETQFGQERHELVTYWVVIGETAIRGGTEKKLAEMRYAMSGEIPDGHIFRISTIDTDSERAYAIHRQFASDLMTAVEPKWRTRVFGKEAL
jgi:EpsI family protein